ncbi:DUF948 domain-containing protein [Paenibacillus sp. GCM10027626]|uniref:DUF948 domain-containing protein n=1 Tax=Paenibacillus sp. GCM10027626 TaxID=3273411 RepID=UPI00363DB1B1
MDLFIQAGMIVIAIAVFILMYAIWQTMKVLRAAIEEMRLMIGQVRTDISTISEDMKEAIHNTNAMTMDIRKKLNSLNVVFTVVNDIGQAVHAFTDAAKHSAKQLAASMEQKHRQSAHSEDDQAVKPKDGISVAIIDAVISSLRIWKKINRL